MSPRAGATDARATAARLGARHLRIKVVRGTTENGIIGQFRTVVDQMLWVAVVPAQRCIQNDLGTNRPWGTRDVHRGAPELRAGLYRLPGCLPVRARRGASGDTKAHRHEPRLRGHLRDHRLRAVPAPPATTPTSPDACSRRASRPARVVRRRVREPRRHARALPHLRGRCSPHSAERWTERAASRRPAAPTRRLRSRCVEIRTRLPACRKSMSWRGSII